jgi:putative Mg2+ transporter-C (MgtC) family protein
VGYGLYDIAFILSATTFLTLRCSRPLKRATNGDVGSSASR